MCMCVLLCVLHNTTDAPIYPNQTNRTRHNDYISILSHAVNTVLVRSRPSLAFFNMTNRSLYNVLLHRNKFVSNEDMCQVAWIFESWFESPVTACISDIECYPMTKGFLRGECSVKDFQNLQRSVMEGSVKVGRVRASPATFGNPRHAIMSRDYHIWRSSSEWKHNAPWALLVLFSCLFL